MGPIFELALIYYDNDMKLALSLSLKYIKLGGFNNLQNIIGIIISILHFDPPNLLYILIRKIH